MAIARNILSGLFGATAGGLRGYATKQAEERERMQRQQEIEAQQEFETGMMRERQAAQRASARRASLQANLEREATEGYRAAQLQQRKDEAKAQIQDEQFADVTREFSAIMRQRAQASAPPLSETDQVELIKRLEALRGVGEEDVAQIVRRLNIISPEAPTPAPAAVETVTDLMRKKYDPETDSPEFTEEELGYQLKELYDAQKYFEDELRVRYGPLTSSPSTDYEAFLGSEAGARARGPQLPENVISGGNRAQRNVISGGTPAQRKDYRAILKTIDEVTGLLTSGRFRSGT